MNYKIEALWDCIYCNSKGIGGSMRDCPNCGHTRGKEVKFYLPKDISIRNAVDESKNTISSGPDWLCGYCRAYNRSENLTCKNCGASRSKHDADYFQINR